MSFRRMGLCCKDLEKLGAAKGVLEMDYEKVGLGHIMDRFFFCPFCGTRLKLETKI